MKGVWIFDHELSSFLLAKQACINKVADRSNNFYCPNQLLGYKDVLIKWATTALSGIKYRYLEFESEIYLNTIRDIFNLSTDISDWLYYL